MSGQIFLLYSIVVCTVFLKYDRSSLCTRSFSTALQYTALGRLSTVGSSDFDKIFENCYASCSFGLAKDISDDFGISIFFGSCVEKFEKQPF
jgi:hypothetical protein